MSKTAFKTLFFGSLIALIGMQGSVATAQITLNKQANMDFGGVEFTAGHNGTIQLGTNGNVSTTGSGLLTHGSTSAGEVDVTGDGASIIEIRCDATAIIAETGGDTLDIQNIEITINVGQAFGTGADCNGSGGGDAPATTHDLSVSATPTIYIGGEVDATGGGAIAESREYTTGNAGGDSITIDVRYQ